MQYTNNKNIFKILISTRLSNEFRYEMVQRYYKFLYNMDNIIRIFNKEGCVL